MAVGLKMSPTGSSPLITQQTATKSLTAITGAMVKNGHLRTKCLSAVAVEPRPLTQPLMPPVSVSTDGARRYLVKTLLAGR